MFTKIGRTGEMRNKLYVTTNTDLWRNIELEWMKERGLSEVN